MGFKTLYDVSADFSECRMMGWRSERTGLEIALIQKQTPIVKGFFAVASEIHDDSGAPHTLEHLVFTGSKKYPYKGFLDLLANQQLSATNAWTDTDQTVYDISTAGWEGFKTVLPVYLDHVLHPTLTDAACLTEVYYVSGDAEEKGVVFCEMQGIENTAEELVSLKVRKLLYPPNSPYASETGGLMSALRVLTPDQIREFHKLRYRPDNLCVIVAGDVEPENLLEVLQEFDDSLTDFERSTKRPFVDTPEDAPLQRSLTEAVEFPEEDESFSIVEMGWIGPEWESSLDWMAIDVLNSYLARSEDGKLNLELVDVQDPLATDISDYTLSFKRYQIGLTFSGVPTDRAETVENTVSDILKRELENLDFNLIKECQERIREKYVLRFEEDTTVITDMMIAEFLHGNPDRKAYAKSVCSLDEFDQLAAWKFEDWQRTLKKYYIDNHHVTVIGKPSKALYEKLKEEKTSRENEIRQQLGEEGLKKKGEDLERAMDENNKPVPENIRDEFDIPDTNKIKFIKTVTAKGGKQNAQHSNEEVQKKVDADTPKGLPVEIHFEHYKSKFVFAQVLISIADVEERLLPYIGAIFGNLLALPMTLPDGTQLSYEEVSAEVKKDTLDYNLSTGDGLEEMFGIFIRAKVENYEAAVEWIRRAFFSTVFDENRIAVIVEKHVNSISEVKRWGPDVLSSSISNEYFVPSSLTNANDALFTEEFYKQLHETLQNGGFDQVKQDLEALRKSLFNTKIFKIFVHGDVLALNKPVSVWSSVVGDDEKMTLPPLELPRTFQRFSDFGKKPFGKAFITPMSATESSFAVVVGQIPADALHPDIPGIELACEILQVLEGPFWRSVRGAGYAYGMYTDIKTERRQLSIDVYRGSDTVGAFNAAAKDVRELADGTYRLDEITIKSGVSSLVHRFTMIERSEFNAASRKYFFSELQGCGADYVPRLLKRANELTAEDIRDIANKYLVPLFDHATSSAFVVCHPSMVESIEAHFIKEGYAIEIKHLNEEESEEDDDEDDETTDDESDDDSDDE